MGDIPQNPKSSEDSRRKASSITDRVGIRTASEEAQLLAEERPLETAAILVEADIPAAVTPAEAIAAAPAEEILAADIRAERGRVAGEEEETRAVEIVVEVAAPVAEEEVPAEVVAAIRVVAEGADRVAEAVDQLEAGAAATN